MIITLIGRSAEKKVAIGYSYDAQNGSSSNNNNKFVKPTEDEEEEEDDDELDEVDLGIILKFFRFLISIIYCFYNYF